MSAKPHIGWWIAGVFVFWAAMAWIGRPPESTWRRPPPTSYLAKVDPGPAPDPADNAAIPLLSALGTDALVGDRDVALTKLGGLLGLPVTVKPPWAPDEVSEARYLDEGEEPTVEQLRLWREWIDGCKPILDALVEASTRPRLWLPIVQDRERGLVQAIPPEALVEVAQLLNSRVELAIWERRNDDAWSDIQVLLRLGTLGDQLEGQLARLVLTGREMDALNHLRSMLQRGAVEERLLQDIRDRLAEQPNPRDLLDDLRFDRYSVLATYRTLVNDMGGTFETNEDAITAHATISAECKAIEKMVASGATRDEIRSAIDALVARTNAMKTWSQKRILRGVIGRREALGRYIGEIVASVLLIIVPNVLDYMHKLPLRRQATMLAAVVQLHAKRHGAFPASLDALVPDSIEKLPPGALGAQIFYEREGDACSLWFAEDEDEDYVIELKLR